MTDSSPSVPVESREQPSHVIELVNNGNHGWECSCGVSAYSPDWSPSSAEADSYSHYPQADPDHPMTQLRAEVDRLRSDLNAIHANKETQAEEAVSLVSRMAGGRH